MERASIEERLARAAMFVRAHLDERLTLEAIGASAAVSPFHFHRLFRVAFGESLGAYVVRHRMQRAAHELRFGDDPIVEIALRCGYESHSAFGRAFVRAFGMTPSAFRSSGTARRAPRAVTAAAGDLREPNVVMYPARDVLGVRFTGPYDAVEPAMRRLYAIARHRGFLPGGTILGLSYDSPDLEDHATLRFEACVTIGRDADVAGARADGLEAIAIPAGRYAVFRHRGPFQRITHAYDRLVAAWVLTGRVTLRDAPFVNTYLTDPAVVAERDLECDLAIPID